MPFEHTPFVAIQLRAGPICIHGSINMMPEKEYDWISWTYVDSFRTKTLCCNISPRFACTGEVVCMFANHGYDFHHEKYVDLRKGCVDM